MIEELTTKKATQFDLEELVKIRIEAMRESLLNIGRFDINRARERLVKNFVPSETTIICHYMNYIGFYSLQLNENICQINHFYLLPEYHNLGIGSFYLNKIKSDIKLCIRLSSIKGSKANKFYEKNGFVKIGENEYDFIYEFR